MNRLLLTSCILSTLLFTMGCSKNSSCDAAPPQITVAENEITAVEEYISTNNITGAVKNNAGFYYKILEAGSGSAPGLCSSVSIFYTGQLTNGTVFDGTSSAPATFTLNQLIAGWQLGVPLIKKGGKIMLYLPPSLGYGSRASGPIPANSVLIFEVSLLDFR